MPDTAPLKVSLVAYPPLGGRPGLAVDRSAWRLAVHKGVQIIEERRLQVVSYLILSYLSLSFFRAKKPTVMTSLRPSWIYLSGFPRNLFLVSKLAVRHKQLSCSICHQIKTIPTPWKTDFEQHKNTLKVCVSSFIEYFACSFITFALGQDGGSVGEQEVFPVGQRNVSSFGSQVWFRFNFSINIITVNECNGSHWWLCTLCVCRTRLLAWWLASSERTLFDCLKSRTIRFYTPQSKETSIDCLFFSDVCKPFPLITNASCLWLTTRY